MEDLKFFSSILFPNLKEIANFNSKEYSEFKLKYWQKYKNCFFNENGNITNSCHIFRNILQTCFVKSGFKKTFIIGMIVKKSMHLEILKSENILEIWMSSDKNFLKRITLILIKGGGDIWQFNLIKKNQKEKILLRSILLFGTSIWIFDLPTCLPQFLNIKTPLFIINLANFFHWKMCFGKNILITGDISGKVTVINIANRLELLQFAHNRKRKIPIGDLKLLEFGVSDRKILVTGGFDGVLRIWSLFGKIVPLKKIKFNRRWIIKLDFNLFYENYILISVGLENGFWSLVCFNDKIKAIKTFLNQGSSIATYPFPNNIISIGNDGYVNLIELNSPQIQKKHYLNLLDNPNFLFNWGKKPKLNNTNVQSIGVKFHFVHLNVLKTSEFNSNLSIFGFSGAIFLFYFSKF